MAIYFKRNQGVSQLEANQEGNQGVSQLEANQGIKGAGSRGRNQGGIKLADPLILRRNQAG